MEDWMKTERFKKGLKKLKEVNGETPRTMVDVLKDDAPELVRLAVEFAYGDVYSGPDLDLKQRQIVTLTAMAMQNSKLLPIHIKAAREVGLSKKEIMACFTHLAAFAGFPVAIQAALAAKKVFSED